MSDTSPKFREDDRTHLLISLYFAIVSKPVIVRQLNTVKDVVIRLDDVKAAFKICGVDIDKLAEEGKISVNEQMFQM